jgi:signal transduction histidine kinase
MKFRKKNILIWKSLFVLVVYYATASTAVAQNSADSISTVVIDSAPKKLYSELYADETGNQFMVEIYEEPQEGENLIHFRSFKNKKIIGRKSQALADAHNFTFFIDETEQRIMRQDTEKMLFNVLKKLMEESDQKLKSNLEDMFDQEKLAQSLSEKIKTPDDQIQTMAEKISKKITFDGGTLKNMAERISEQIKTPDEQIQTMAEKISKKITFDGGTLKNMAERISEQIKTPDEQIAEMATRISNEIKTPDEQIATMANEISKKITFDGGAITDMAERISKQIKTPENQISKMASQISQQIKTPEDQISNMASQISQQIKTPEARVNEESLALTLAIKLTQKENLVAVKIPPYAELLSQVSDSNQKQDYENTIAILDEDIADRTPEEQRKALKISGLMSVLVASKKLKRAISTIEDYDLPDDPALREISAALSQWVSKHLVVK